MKTSDNNISPILNNPYEEPKWHYDVTLEGNLDYSRILEGRRPYSAHLTVMPDALSAKSLFSAGDIPIEEENANFINGIRQVVKEWREQGYPKVTRTSRDLLVYWFLNPERELNKSLFFCQREAVETAVYLNEVAPRDPNLGRSILHELDMRRETISDKKLFKFYSKIILWQRYAAWLRAYRPCIHSQWSVS